MAYVNPISDLRRLKFASATVTFQRLQSIAKEITAKYDKPIDSANAGKLVMPVRMTDNTAMTLFRDGDLRDDVRPIETTGDGNCLFNVVSIAICQTEILAAELRLRTALELILNPDFYGAHPVVTLSNITTKSGGKWSKEGLYDAIILSNNSSKILAKGGFESALQYEICSTLHDGRFSGLLQIMGLVSASGCDIQLVYPDNRHSLVSLLSAVYSPRVGTSTAAKFSIMWTDTVGWPDRLKEFKVNHFVPLLKVDTQDNWITITRKRKMAKASNYDEKKRSSPTNRNKTTTFPLNSPPYKTRKKRILPTR